MDTTQYVSALALPQSVVSNEAHARIVNLSALLCGIDTAENIFEVELAKPLGAVDFSIAIENGRQNAVQAAQRAADKHGTLAWNNTARLLKLWADPATETHKRISNVWLEFDYDACAGSCADPCVFFDAAQAADNLAWACAEPLYALMGRAPSDNLARNLSDCILALPEGVGLFQLGVMLSRTGGEDRIRVFTNEMNASQFLGYIERVGLAGLLPQGFLNRLGSHSDGKYIADFDVTESGCGAKLGVNFGLASYRRETMLEFFELLCAEGAMLAENFEPLAAWNGFSRDVSHCKLVFDAGGLAKAKAYLREWPADRLGGLARW